MIKKGAVGTMKDEQVAVLELENQRLREDNKELLSIIAQMKVTLNRLVSHYITENK